MKGVVPSNRQYQKDQQQKTNHFVTMSEKVMAPRRRHKFDRFHIALHLNSL